MISRAAASGLSSGIFRHLPLMSLIRGKLENSVALWKQENPYLLKLLDIRYGPDIGFQRFLPCFSLLFPAGNRRAMSKLIIMESCPSGRRYSTRNAARSQILPGFESLTLRHRALQRYSAGFFLCPNYCAGKLRTDCIASADVSLDSYSGCA